MKRGQIFRGRYKNREAYVTRDGDGYLVTYRDGERESVEAISDLEAAKQMVQQFIYPLLTTAEAAATLGCTSNHVRLLCKQGELPGAIKPSRDWLIPREAVEKRKAADVKPGPKKA